MPGNLVIGIGPGACPGVGVGEGVGALQFVRNGTHMAAGSGPGALAAPIPDSATTKHIATTPLPGVRVRRLAPVNAGAEREGAPP